MNADKTSVVYGFGGRWLTYYYTAEGEAEPRDLLIKRCQDFFRQYGWGPNPEELSDNFVLSKKYELPLESLRFKRGAFPHQKSHWFSRSYTYISENGQLIIQYCSVGW